MKKKIGIILLIIIFLFTLLVAVWRIDRTYFHPYIPNFSEQIRSDVTTLKFTVPKDKEACEKIGGVWKKLGPRPFEECNIPTQDTGKECRGSNQCEGVCIADLTRDQITEGMKGKLFKTLGKCSSFIKVLGCRAYVYQDWAQVICAD